MDYGMACRRASPSKVIGSRDICLLPSLISRQLPASPMLVFPRRVAHALNVAVRRPGSATQTAPPRLA
jgi:hypothetical protein